MFKLSNSQADLVLEVFADVNSLADFIGRFKVIQQDKIKFSQTGIGNGAFYKSDEYFEQCAIYLQVAKYCHDARLLKTSLDPKLDNINFDLVMFTSGSNDLASVLQSIDRFARATPNERDQLIKPIFRTITTSSYLIHETQMLFTLLKRVSLDQFGEDFDVNAEYQKVKSSHQLDELKSAASSNGVNFDSLVDFYNRTIELMAIDGDVLSDLVDVDGIGWKERAEKAKCLVMDLIGAFKLAGDVRSIKGLSHYV